MGTPPSLEHWAISYTAAFLMLALVASAAPELAASLAAMAVIRNLLTNGVTIAADLSGLEGTTATAPPVRASTTASGAATVGQVKSGHRSVLVAASSLTQAPGGDGS